MKVQCKNCGAKLNIPDDKLVPGTDFSFNCPKCSEKQTVSVPKADEAAAAAPPQPDTSFPTNGEDDPSLGEFYEEGAKPVLICFDPGPARDRLVEVMEDLGFTTAPPPKSAREAIQRIRSTQYRALLLHDLFDGLTLENNAILKFIQPMDMTTRRRIFVALFSEKLNSMDHMTAFAYSVNTVIGTADQEDYGKILNRAISEYERFYKVFFDVLHEMGKT